MHTCARISDRRGLAAEVAVELEAQVWCRSVGATTVEAKENHRGLAQMTHDADDSGSDQPSLDELISLREAAELSGLSTSYLRLLVSRGDMWGVKLGRNWVTTTQAVEEFLARERRRGPKPKKPRD